MRHPTEGILRRLVDEPAGVADTERQHVAGCATCLSALATVQQDAVAAGTALDLDVTADGTDVDAGWHRLSGSVAAQWRPAAPARGPRTARASRWRSALRSPAVAAVGVVAVLGGTGAAAAADWLPFFRTEQVAPLSITEADLLALPDLSAYGDLEVLTEPDVREVADAAAAAEATGLSVPVVDELPQGVTVDPVLQVGDPVTAVFTFSADKAEAAAAAAGETLPDAPDGMDGNRFRLEAGPGVVQVWSGSQGLPALVVARAGAPTASSSGVPFETARDYLLSLPGMPDDVAAQLRAFSADGTTLPLPLPADRVTTSEAEVDGVPATVVTTRDGTMAGVVWVDEGVVTAVLGSLSDTEVLEVAEELRTR
jgi:hypothetical protein